LTTDVGGDDDFRLAAFQRGELVVTQLFGNFRLGDRVAARRTTAQVRVRHGSELEAQAGQHVFDCATELLCVLQRAGAMEGHAPVGLDVELLEFSAAQDFYQVLGQVTDPRRLDGIGRVVLEQVAVFLDEGAAAAGGLHDGLGTSLDGRPPGVDVATSAVQPGFLGVEVVVHRATATGFTNGR